MNWKALAVSIVIMLFSYLAGAFVAADFNISNWSHIGRFMVSVSGVAAGIIAGIGVADYTERKQ
jgi:hypothetical protein